MRWGIVSYAVCSVCCTAKSPTKGICRNTIKRKKRKKNLFYNISHILFYLNLNATFNSTQYIAYELPWECLFVCTRVLLMVNEWVDFFFSSFDVVIIIFIFHKFSRNLFIVNHPKLNVIVVLCDNKGWETRCENRSNLATEYLRWERCGATAHTMELN